MKTVIITGSVLLTAIFFVIIGYNTKALAGVAAQEAVRKSELEKPGTPAGLSISFPETAPVSSVEIQAQSGAVIEFETQNGLSLSGKIPQSKSLPHLVLFRNGELTEPEERTLQLAISSVRVPTSEVTLTLGLETQHPDPDLGGASRIAIPVWETEMALESSESSQSIVISHTFDARIADGPKPVSTPTDYYRMQLILTDAQHTEENPLFSHVEEFTFLLESQLKFELPGVTEEQEGAAPDELVIYYCDMFPFQSDYLDASSRLPREDVEAFVRDDLGPSMVNAYKMQSVDWGFTWYSTWKSYRSGADSDRLSVALTMPGVWYHGRAPSSAHSGISINTTNEEFAGYDNLFDGIMSAFQHELFHNIQRNINLHYGGEGDVDGEGDAWAFITEGMATMASSVGQPDVEFSKDGTYLTKANTFLSGDKFYEHDLNTRYGDLDPYRASIYWRYLYEQCGGLKDGEDDPTAGMEVLRKTLEALYSRTDLEDGNLVELIDLLPALMDNVLAQSSTCPFENYRQSLAQFSRTIYAFRIAGECVINQENTSCGLYDPQSYYAVPPAEEIEFGAEGGAFSGQIPNSYGMDFIELQWLDQKSDYPVEVEFNNLSAGATFEVQVLKIDELEPGLIPGEKGLSQVQTIEKTITADEGKYNFYINPAEEGEKLAVIITRVDGDEAYDPEGAYSVSLR